MSIGSRRSSPTNEIRISTGLDAKGFVFVEVADTGSGMSREVQDRLFTPFFTTKPVGVGTGLGLPICKRILTDLGGSIEVESEPGKGSVFRVHLPPSTSAVRPSHVAPGTRVPPARRRGRVLVAEDEAVFAMVVGRSLSEEHEVIVTTRAREALEKIAAGERFDVILCDLMMPEVTGMDLHAELERSAPELAQRVIFMTGGAFTPRARAFLEHVSNPRLEKPFLADQLRALVNSRIR